MSPWLFNVCMDEKMKRVKMKMGKMRMKSSENGKDWKLSCLLYTNFLELCEESEEGLRVMPRK